nr:transporter substrate-binding domain-containing protein [Caballeronia sp. BR00000012568055]
MADARADPPLVIGAVPAMVPPLDMADSVNHCSTGPGVPHGISTDFVREIAHALGVEPHWRFFTTRAAMIDALRRGEIEMATGGTGEDGNDSGPPLALSRPYFPVRLIHVEPIAARAPTHRLAYVGAQTSERRLRAAYPTLEPVAYPALIDALLAVSLGDADAFVGDATATAYAITHFDLPNLTITALTGIDQGGYSFVFASQQPGADALRQRVDAALGALPQKFALIEQVRWNPGAYVLRRTARIALTPEEIAWMHDHPVVHYSMLADAAPLMFRDSRGQPAGITIDTLDAIARVTGLHFEPRIRAKTEQLSGDLKQGVSAVIPYSIGDLSVLPGGEPTASVGESIFAIVTKTDQPRMRDAAALAGKRVALPRYSAIENFVREAAPSAHFIYTPPFAGQFSAVADDRADATVVNLALANYAVGNPYHHVLTISGVLSPLPIPTRLLVASSEPVLLGIVNRAIASLPPAEFESIRARWKLSEHPEALWERRRPQVALGAGLGAALLLVIGLWAISLRTQIVRRIAAERAMRVARDEAEAANRAKSTFLATMSHEIRTPMNAVLGLLELELRAPGERDATERALTTAHRAARDLLGMIDDLLDIAKIEAERLVLTAAPLELETWVEHVVAIYEPAARAKGIALVVKRDGANGPAWVLADGQRLRQIVGNLLSNAIKFTDTGAVTLEYAIQPADAAQRAVTLSVADTGVGIPPDRQAALFTPFVQAHDGGARQFGGTGLGLTICKRLVTMMGGVIELSSEIGRGTRFTVHVTFPETAAQASPLTRQESADVPGRALSGRCVLIVDDHPANRIVLDGQLRLLGAVTRLASDGRAALSAWHTERDTFDVILTDCSMPEMSGEELTQAIRQSDADVPIVGLTADAQPEARARALASGMTACLVKPIGLDELRNALVSVMRGPSREHEHEAPFDAAALDAFGDSRAALIETLKASNEQDLADAHAAMQSRDYTRLRELAHRMKGASAMIGAAPFVQACIDLQAACDGAMHGEHDDGVSAAFETFVSAAVALDAALGVPVAR